MSCPRLRQLDYFDPARGGATSARRKSDDTHNLCSWRHRNVPACQVTILASPRTWQLEVGIVKDLPVPVLLGRDWPGFDQLMVSMTQPATKPPARRRRRVEQNGGRQPVLLATESDGEGECNNSTNMYMNLFQQITAGGSFGREQRKDERLKNCWSQVRVMEEEIMAPAGASSNPLLHNQEWTAILCRAAAGRGETTLSGAEDQN